MKLKNKEETFILSGSKAPLCEEPLKNAAINFFLTGKIKFIKKILQKTKTPSKKKKRQGKEIRVSEDFKSVQHPFHSG